MKKISIKRILVNAILALIMGFGVSAFAGGETSVALTAASIVFLVGTGGQLVFGTPKFMEGSLYMALQTEVWVQDIQETLFYENEFLNLAVDHSAFVINKTVHVPQSGGKPNVVKNRTEDVAEIKRRTDTELTYDLDNYTTDPFLIKDVEELQLSYAKRQSVLAQHVATLGDVIAVETLQKWAVNQSATHVIRTTGTAEADISLPNSTATGTRNRLTFADIARGAAIMDVDKVPKLGRFAVIPTCMYYGLFSDKDLVLQQATIGKDMLEAGVVAKLFGFNIITRGATVTYTNSGANNLRAASAASAATDCAGAVMFSRFMVSQALGSINLFYNPGEARSYGDLMSAEVNHAANFLRAENIGQVTIAQGYVAP
jgi:hypothetical protein